MVTKVVGVELDAMPQTVIGYLQEYSGKRGLFISLNGSSKSLSESVSDELFCDVDIFECIGVDSISLGLLKDRVLASGLDSESFLLVDAFSSLLVYLTPSQLEDFSQWLADVSSQYGFDVVIVWARGNVETLSSSVLRCFDKVIS